MELIKDIVKYLSSGLVEYFFNVELVKDKNILVIKVEKWAEVLFYMSLIVSILLIES